MLINSRNKILLTLLLVLVVLGSGFYVYKKYHKSDPFEGIQPQTFGIEGKVIRVEGNRLVFEGAVSSIRNGKTIIDMVQKTAVLDSSTQVYRRVIPDDKVLANASDIKVNTQIVVSTKQNPNVDSELMAQEILILR